MAKAGNVDPEAGARRPRLSAAGLPVVTVTHGSSTAGGAYQTELSDYIVMVRGRTRAFLAGPPLLMAAIGEVATEEELGGAEMHTQISGLGDFLGDDDRDTIRIARELMSRMVWPLQWSALQAGERPGSVRGRADPPGGVPFVEVTVDGCGAVAAPAYIEAQDPSHTDRLEAAIDAVRVWFSARR